MNNNMHAPLPISGVVITKNEADRISRCLESMRGLCAELLVVDSGSDDDTVAVATTLGARVVHQDWLGYAAQKNHAMSLATQPWLLLLDADEWLADGAADSIRTLFTGNLIEEADAWVLTRHNWFLGRRLRQGEPSERLVRPGWRYLEALVHERPDLTGKRLRPLDAVIEHDTARSYADHLRKHATLGAATSRQRQAQLPGRRLGARTCLPAQVLPAARRLAGRTRGLAVPPGAHALRGGQIPLPATTER